jgi:DNA repair protein RecO (recombination protein O)
MAPVLQPGNSVDLVWRARLDEHLGAYAVEPTRARAALALADPCALAGLNWLTTLLRLTPEREPHPALYEAASVVADHLGASLAARALMARLELELLGELGFGLDLECCAATGTTADLVYVSPKSGRAVSRAAGAPWAERLLALPAFLKDAAAPPDEAALAAGFALTGYFLERDLFGPRGMALPEARARFARG